MKAILWIAAVICFFAGLGAFFSGSVAGGILMLALGVLALRFALKKGRQRTSLDLIEASPPVKTASDPTPAAARTHGASTADCIDLDPDIIAAVRSKLIAFDVETTGLNPKTDRIVELGAVLYVDGNTTERFSTLVNPGIPMPAAASSVNHITNNMLASAPGEEEACRNFMSFIGDAAHGITCMCAHNAGFDFSFLCETLSRLGYDAEFRYLDTLKISKRLIKGLADYKQSTIERHFDLSSSTAHRAGADAETCGNILFHLIEIEEERLERERAKREKSIPNKDELKVCAVIQKILTDHNKDISCLGFRKISGGYVDACCLYPFVRFKFAKKGKYLIFDKSVIEDDLSLSWEPCTSSEGGADKVRVFFEKPSDLRRYEQVIIEQYKDAFRNMSIYRSQSSYTQKAAKEQIESFIRLSKKEVEKLLRPAE